MEVKLQIVNCFIAAIPQMSTASPSNTPPETTRHMRYETTRHTRYGATRHMQYGTNHTRYEMLEKRCWDLQKKHQKHGGRIIMPRNNGEKQIQ